MAIKVNGTTVIDDSRNLVNIASGAGASTTLGDVGTYGFFRTSSGDNDPGTTRSGSGMLWSDTEDNYNSSPTPSGTWRCMGHQNRFAASTLFVRIS